MTYLSMDYYEFIYYTIRERSLLWNPIKLRKSQIYLGI